MAVLGIIPARRGSRGVPGKNVRQLGNKAVIEYTIADALSAQRLDKAAVTSDDPQVEEICKKYEEITFVKRPGELAGDTVRIDEVMRHCCRALKGRFNYQPDIVALLYANVPVRAAVIAGYNDFAGQITDRAVMDMAPPERYACGRLQECMTIRADGGVSICQQDFKGEYEVGNVHKTSVSELWRSEAWEKLRQAHREGEYEEHALCARCREWHR